MKIEQDADSSDQYFKGIISSFLGHALDVKARREYFSRQESSTLKSLSSVFEESFKVGTVRMIEVIGAKGSGKRSTIRQICERHKVDRFVSINCLIYKTPNAIMDAIRIACGVEVQFDDLQNENEEQGEQLEGPTPEAGEPVESDFWSQIFFKCFKKHKIVLYFSHIEHLCLTNRQTFLYSLLDNLSVSNTKAVIVFATSNLFLLDALERRVKSRFSATRYFFGTENSLDLGSFMQFLLSPPGRPEDQKYAKCVANYFANKKVKEKIQFMIDLDGDINRLVKLFVAFFCKITPFGIRQMIRNPPNGNHVFNDALASAYEAIGRTSYEKILKSLPDCHVIVLREFKRLVQEKRETEMQAVEIIKATTVDLHARQQHSYTYDAVLYVLTDLDKMGLIKIKKKPVTRESPVLFVGNNDLLSAMEKL